MYQAIGLPASLHNETDVHAPGSFVLIDNCTYYQILYKGIGKKEYTVGVPQNTNKGGKQKVYRTQVIFSGR